MSKRRGKGDPTPTDVFATIGTLTKKLKSMSSGSLAQTKSEFLKAHFNFEEANASLLECAGILESIQNVSPPVARLPPEVLLIIFRLVQGPSTRLLPHSAMEPQMHAWLAVTHVCRGWRIVAGTHTELWRTLQLDLHNVSPASATEQLKYYLERSGAAQLRIGINGLYTAAQSEAVVKALSSDLHRVEELTVCGSFMVPSFETWLPISGMLDKNEFPQLRALQLNMLGPEPPSLHENCPRLESLALQGYVDPTNLGIQSLRQLQLSFQTYDSWRQLQAMSTALKELPQLEDLWFADCKISMFYELDANPIPVTAVRIPHLRNLAFNGCKETATTAISGLFDLKAQEELALMCTAQDEENPFVGLVQALFSCLPTPADDLGWTLSIEFHGDRSSVTFASTSCALRLISRDFLMWDFNEIVALRLAEITAAAPVKKFHLRILPEPGVEPVDEPITLEEHPMKTVVDLMFDLVDRRCPTEHHFQLPELSRKAVEQYLNKKRASPQTYHFYPSPGVVSASEDKQMLTRFSKWARKAREGGIANVIFHTSGSPPQLELPPVCTSARWRWRWPGWGPNAVFNDDGSDDVERRNSKVRMYGISF